MQKVKFEKNFFISNRQKLRELFSGTAPIVITASGVLQRSGDTNFKFEQDSSFWYLTGLDDPGLVLVMDKGKEYLIVPDRTKSQELFDGVVELDYLSKRSGVVNVLSEDSGWKQIGARLKRVKHVATLAAPATYIEAHGLYTNPARSRLIQKIKEVNPNIEFLDLRTHLVRLRCIKQPQELSAIARAIDITIDTIREVTRPSRLSKYHFEYQLEVDITKGFIYRGAEDHAFLPIVASGKHACVIHQMDKNSRMRPNDLVTIDVGAQVSHYAADITRTVSLKHQPSPRQKAVFQAVLEVQDYALGLIKPGIILREYEKQIEEYMGEKLRELGLIKSISNEAVRNFFPHGTSHFLGLDTHDVGDYEQPLQSGMVITCEPGIYIPKEGIAVRIEDDVLITTDGIEVLSRRLPRSLD